MSFAQKIKSSSGNLVYLVRGQDKGRDAWHYVQVKDKITLAIFLKEINGGGGDISLYGDILYSGWGKNPPDDIIKKVQENYS